MFRPSRQCLYALICVSLIAAAHRQTFAQEYGFDVWTTANGLPQNTVTGVVQTPDGYLWLSTFDGLARFDGVRFAIFDKGNTKGIVNNRFARLFADRAGSLYAVTEDNVVTVYRGGEFVSYTQFAAASEAVAEIKDGADGDPVFETTKGYYRLDGGRFVLTSGRSEPNSGYSYTGGSGSKWVIEPDRIIGHKDGQETHYSLKLADAELSSPAALALFEDRHGSLWLRRRLTDFELWRLQDGSITTYTQKDIPGLRELYPRYAKEDADGKIWFLLTGLDTVKPNQLALFDNGRFTSHELNEAIGPIASLTDREGNFWLATSTGLRRLRQDIITTLSVNDGLNSNEVYPLIQTSSGDIFIGTVKGVNRYTEGKITDTGLTYPSSKQTLYMRGLWEDDQRRLWLGYQGEGGFGRLAEPNPLIRIGKKDLPSGGTDFASDRDGNIWIATDEGLFKFKDDQEIAHYTADDGLPSGRVVTIHADRGGGLLLGTFDGLAQLKNDKIYSYNAEPNAPQGIVRALYEDAEGVLWIGTYGDGLVRYREGNFFNYRVEHGLFNNGVFAILEDDRGNFWMSSNRGIHTVPKKELDDLADGRISKLNSYSYDEKDGMLNAECNGGRFPSAIKTRDGRFWFPTMGGVAIVDPNAEKVNSQPPPVVIESFFIDRKPVDPRILSGAIRDPRSAIELDPGRSNIAFEYTGLSLIKSAQIKFRYKLEGLEESWVEAGTRRSVDYSYLPAGSYTFRVIAANANGVWNNEGSAVRIVVHPFFYQTWWFTVLLVLAFGFVIWWFYYTRISRLRLTADAKTQFSRQLIESQEAERKRIASELHDGLGQSLVIIKNRAALGLNKGDDRERVTRELNSISESASQALDEVREITNNLRPQLLDRLGLTKAIRAMLNKTAGVVEIESRVDDIDGLFSEYQEISIYRIIQESVNNVIKHSNASNAVVIAKRDGDDLTVVVQDNGKGFDTTNFEAERRSMGLVGLKERAQLLKGKFSVDSKPGEGTTIRVSIPVSIKT